MGLICEGFLCFYWLLVLRAVQNSHLLQYHWEVISA